jgi:DNA-binding NarL/FixJ family response regulator
MIEIKILLVDDVESVRKGLSTILKLMNDFKIVGEAGNGLEAIQCAKLLKPDVILMDLTMPKLNGFEATRRIKREYPEIGIIAFSIHDDVMTRERACAAGADAFVEKEAETQLLIEAIWEVSDKNRHRMNSAAG